MNDSRIITFLFTDIEGSTRLWDREPERMREALARHDALSQQAIERHRGTRVKSTGDGVHAVFDDPADAIAMALDLQLTLADSAATAGVLLPVRCGLHCGTVERRDNDYFGSNVNRAARIMGSANGGQVLLSQAVALLVGDRLPAETALYEIGTVRLRGFANPERVFQLGHPRLRRHFPPLRSLEDTPHNLPRQLTSFIGREREAADVRALLESTRLLTIHGAGGLGKTRLSLAVAASVLDEYPDGVWFVDLAPVTDSSLVPQRVAAVLGTREESGRPLQEALLRYARDRKFLLILDNCEHLAGACAGLAKALLQGGGQTAILATSREPLHVAGESTYPLASFSAPAPGEALTAENLQRHPATRLFCERAQSARPDFSVTAQNAGAIAEICRRVDGIPLAIELAAARVRSMAVEQIAERVRDRLDLLTSRDRTVMPRQRTLRALIDWSHDLLDDDERTLFRRLAVFAGGFTLEGAEQVGLGGALAKDDIVDLLQHLVEKSLVVMEADGKRYRMLETMRQYAGEQLAHSADADDARRRHLQHHVALVEQARPHLVSPDAGEWLARLDLERENILCAHANACGAPELAGDGLRLIASTKMYWIQRGLLVLGHRVTMEALERYRGERPNLTHGRGLFSAGDLCYFMGQYDSARALLEQALDVAHALHNDAMAAAVLMPLGMACLGQRDFAAARDYLDQALTLARTARNERALPAALNAIAQLHRLEGQFDAAESLCTEVVALAERHNDRESLAIALLNMAMTAIERSAPDRAAGILRRVLGLMDASGSTPAEQAVVEVAAGLAAARGEWPRAAGFFAVAQACATASGLHRDPADEAFYAPLLERTRTEVGVEAINAAGRADRDSDDPYALAEIRAWLESS